MSTNNPTPSKQQQQQQQSYFACQVCGVLLKLDTSIETIDQVTYSHLTDPIRNDATLINATTDTALYANIDPDMELSINATVLSKSRLNERSGLSDDEQDLLARQASTGGGASRLFYEPLFNQSLSPRSFYLCPTSTNLADISSALTASSLNNQSTSHLLNTDLMSGWSARINATSALFDIMSSNTNVDHPLCEECADQLVNQLDAQCKQIEKEHLDYTNLVNKLNKSKSTTASSNVNEIAELEKELERLKSEESSLMAELDTLEKTESELVTEREQMLNEERALLQREQNTLVEYSKFKQQLIKLEEKQESLDNQLKSTSLHLKRLRTVNVLNATFHIWHSGPFGTINYFRLGKLPDTQVEWDEINAGLGQVILLLYCLAKKLKFEFRRFRLVPFGNYSYIEVIENCTIAHCNFKVGEEVNLYRMRGFKYYLEWSDSKFDSGLIAFLDCLQQFEEKIKSLDAQFSTPYKINGSKLEDKSSLSAYSIKCQFNSFEEWTKALKYMLTNLKFMQAFIASKSK